MDTKSQATIDEEILAQDILLMSLKAITNDGYWKYFGFKKTPKRGLAFDRFVKENELRKETFLARELLISSMGTALLCLPESYSYENKVKITLMIFKQLFEEKGFLASLKFTSSQEAYRYASMTVADYLECKDFKDLSSIFLNHAKSFLDSLPKEFVFGVVSLFTIGYDGIKYAMYQTIADNPHSVIKPQNTPREQEVDNPQNHNEPPAKNYEMACPRCGQRMNIKLYNPIDAVRYPEFKSRILDRTLFINQCSICHAQVEAPYVFLYFDTDKRIAVLFLGVKEYKDYSDFVNKVAEMNDPENSIWSTLIKHGLEPINEYTLRAVNNPLALIEKIAIAEDGYDDRLVEYVKAMLISSVNGKDLGIEVVEMYYNHIGKGFEILFSNESSDGYPFSREEFDDAEAEIGQLIDRESETGFVVVDMNWVVSKIIKNVDVSKLIHMDDN